MSLQDLREDLVGFAKVHPRRVLLRGAEAQRSWTPCVRGVTGGLRHERSRGRRSAAACTPPAAGPTVTRTWPALSATAGPAVQPAVAVASFTGKAGRPTIRGPATVPGCRTGGRVAGPDGAGLDLRTPTALAPRAPAANGKAKVRGNCRCILLGERPRLCLCPGASNPRPPSCAILNDGRHPGNECSTLQPRRASRGSHSA
mmetsp:Transcript_33457/g.92641  ORF Transcript_33457/g.92641 Transcript_33457/m.92641 type:complete len:201 (-) Transcript_33457:2-604(-)